MGDTKKSEKEKIERREEPEKAGEESCPCEREENELGP
jgi:hypothetical protein